MSDRSLMRMVRAWPRKLKLIARRTFPCNSVGGQLCPRSIRSTPPSHAGSLHAAMAPWRTIRVFISSTFRDMHAERDYLVRFVFPRLREELLPRRIHFVDVDLR